jgi:YggT family protein
MVYVVYIVQGLASLLRIVILARAVISWVRPDPYNPLVRFLYQVTEPILRPLRQVLPTWQSVDISPVVALVIIELAEWLLVRLVLLG